MARFKQICNFVENYHESINKTNVRNIMVPYKPDCSIFQKTLYMFGNKCKEKYEIKTIIEYTNETIPKTRQVEKCCDGWTDLEKSNCSIPVCNPTCLHGTCVQPYKCKCFDGWRGSVCGDKCQGGTYGPGCFKFCNCGNGSVTCHHKTGECQCAPGFMGQKCQENCPLGRYGFGCSDTCECFYPWQCRPSDGFCDCSIHHMTYLNNNNINNDSTDNNNFIDYSGKGKFLKTLLNNPFEKPESLESKNAKHDITFQVTGFFTGPTCSDPCQPDLNCTRPCDCDLLHGDCNPYTGQCICKPGYMGLRCQVRCPVGTFGPECLGNCLCQNNSTCDHVLGKCSCLPGWSGEGCQYACQKGWYGSGCTFACHQRCQHYETCEALTGDCLCKSGWTGPSCELPCPRGTFGPQCWNACRCDDYQLSNREMREIEAWERSQLTTTTTTAISYRSFNNNYFFVSSAAPTYFFVDNFDAVYNDSLALVFQGLHNSSSNHRFNEMQYNFTNVFVRPNTSRLRSPNVCDTITGRCLCPPGRTGPQCHKLCPSFRYGPDCVNECECEHAMSCNAITGQCETCNEGWHGERCHIACSKGYYGLNCAIKCNCVGAETCHPITGTCICPAGKTGNNCSENCPPGWFGIFCQHKCSCPTNDNNWCDPVSGYCSCPPGFATRWRCSRCQPGLWGADCKSNCSCPTPSPIPYNNSNRTFIPKNQLNNIPTSLCDRKTGVCLCFLRDDKNIHRINSVTIKKDVAQTHDECIAQAYQTLDFETAYKDGSGIYNFDPGQDQISNHLIPNGGEYTDYEYKNFLALDKKTGMYYTNGPAGKKEYMNYLGSDYDLAREMVGYKRLSSEQQSKRHQTWSSNDFNLMSIILIIVTSTLIVILFISLTVCLVVRRRKKQYGSGNKNIDHSIKANGHHDLSNPTTLHHAPSSNSILTPNKNVSSFHPNSTLTSFHFPPSPPPIDFLVHQQQVKAHLSTLNLDPSGGNENIYNTGLDDDIYEIDYEYPTSVFGTIERKGFNSMSISPPINANPSLPHSFNTYNCKTTHQNGSIFIGKNILNQLSPRNTNQNGQETLRNRKVSLGSLGALSSSSGKNVHSSDPTDSSKIELVHLKSPHIRIKASHKTFLPSNTKSSLSPNSKASLNIGAKYYHELRESTTSSSASLIGPPAGETHSHMPGVESRDNTPIPDIILNSKNTEAMIFSSNLTDSFCSNCSNTLNNENSRDSTYLIPIPVDAKLVESTLKQSSFEKTIDDVGSPLDQFTSQVHTYHKLDDTGKSFESDRVLHQTQKHLRQYYERDKIALKAVTLSNGTIDPSNSSVTAHDIDPPPNYIINISNANTKKRQYQSKPPPPVPLRNAFTSATNLLCAQQNGLHPSHSGITRPYPLKLKNRLERQSQEKISVIVSSSNKSLNVLNNDSNHADQSGMVVDKGGNLRKRSISGTSLTLDTVVNLTRPPSADSICLTSQKSISNIVLSVPEITEQTHLTNGVSLPPPIPAKHDSFASSNTFTSSQQCHLSLQDANSLNNKSYYDISYDQPITSNIIPHRLSPDSQARSSIITSTFSGQFSQVNSVSPEDGFEYDYPSTSKYQATQSPDTNSRRNTLTSPTSLQCFDTNSFAKPGFQRPATPPKRKKYVSETCAVLNSNTSPSFTTSSAQSSPSKSTLPSQQPYFPPLQAQPQNLNGNDSFDFCEISYDSPVAAQTRTDNSNVSICNNNNNCKNNTSNIELPEEQQQSYDSPVCLNANRI